MRDDIDDIAAFYDGSADAEQQRLARHQLEFDLTMRYLEQYLPPRGRILELGAATGRYTMALAQRGYKLTAVDLSAVQLDVCRTSLRAAGLEAQVELVVADARDLTGIGGAEYDAVLVMGPLYHLVYEADRATALREAVARLRSGGVLLSAWLSRHGVLGDLLARAPVWIDDADAVAAMLTLGRRPDDQPRGGFRGYFALASELPPFHEALGLQTLVVAGVEPCIGPDDDSYNRLAEPQRGKWLDLLYAVSAEPSTIGASRHLLYIGRA